MSASDTGGRTFRGRALLDGGFVDDVEVRLAGTRIAEVRPGAGSRGERVPGAMVPGFIDVHVHGAGGADFMDGTEQAVRRVLTEHARHGTTALAATTLSGGREDVARAIDAIARTWRQGRPGEAEIAAIHLEGPYVSPARAGAQDRASLRPADPAELAGWLEGAPELAWMMTVAPEVEGVLALLERFAARVTFSIGHTTADFALATEALARGARHFTHLFNAMTPLGHREPGAVGAAMAHRAATAELIADGVHVHPAVLRIAHAAMRGRIALVTDAMRACGMPDGVYALHKHEVHVRGGAARLPDGTLAGSVLTMAGAVRTMVEAADVPLAEVVPLATAVPARLLGLEGRKARIAAGFDADLVVLGDDLSVARVIARGEEVRDR